jgi:polysaccharide biosynthesis/export protein
VNIRRLKQQRAFSGGRLARTFATLALAFTVSPHVFAQQARSGPAVANAPKASSASVAPSGVTTPDDYVIGPDDLLSVVFWRDKDMSADVAVRPDGKISLPVINEVIASGLTPEQLRARVTEAASKFLEDPTVSVVVKAINSRKVFITGMVAKSGDYSIPGRTTVLQLIAMAGGLHEFADAKNITINRTENGRQVSLRFNYKDVSKGKNLRQNIELKPGDTVIVP